MATNFPLPEEDYELVEGVDPEAPTDDYMTGDEPLAEFDDLTVVQAVLACKEESESARQYREDLNQINFDAFHCRQDYSGKRAGQSTEFLPKVAMAVEQFAAFILRGLIAYGDYFSVKLSPDPSVVGGPLTESGVTKLIRHRLENPSQLCPGCLDFPTTVADGVKLAGLAPPLVMKVCGHFVPSRRPVVVDQMTQAPMQDPMTGQSFMGPQPVQTLEIEEGTDWRLAVELIRSADYFPDPKGRDLYEIHRTRRDLYEIIDRSEGDYPEYDPEAVIQLAESFGSYVDPETESELERETTESVQDTPGFRKEVELLEFWGTLLNSDGNVVHRDIRCVVANGRFLLKKPEPNPYWHQESPFVSEALLRVPGSVFHKGLFDHAVALNLALNDIFNLMVDGGIASVWGVRQVRKDALENPEDFDGGVENGATAFIRPDFPSNEDAIRQLIIGSVPQDAFAVYQLIDREFNSATKLSDTAQGSTPRKDVSATAVASADQATSIFFDSIIAALERFISKVLRLCWLTMLQNVDNWNEDDTIGCIGPQAAQELQMMSPAQRYVRYGQGAAFRVTGLSSMMSRTRDFQKFMAISAAITQSPFLLQAFMMSSSPEKLLNYLFKSVNIDPEDLMMSPEEKATVLERMQMMQQMSGPARGAQGDQQAENEMTQQPGNPIQQTQASISQLNQVPQGL